jgi:hypothetical protein
MLILSNFIFLCGIICINIYYFMIDIFNITFITDNINYIILFYNKYKFIDYYYYIYISFYPIYKNIKKFTIFLYFNMLKFYIIFINDTIFFSLNNFFLILFYKLKK